MRSGWRRIGSFLNVCLVWGELVLIKILEVKKVKNRELRGKSENEYYE